MTTAATLDTNLTLNSTAFRQGMIQAANQANTSLKSIQAQATQTASVLSTLNKAAAAFGRFELLKGGLGSLLQAQVQLQSIQYTLLSATGNTLAAGQAMQFLREESEKVGLSLPDTAEGFARLAAAASASGVGMQEQEKLFDAFAKASSTLHLSTAQSGRALLALQEMFSRGTISARQLNQQLGQAIPGSAARFKNAVMEMTQGTNLQGKSFEELQKKGLLVTTQFMPALTAALQQSGSGWEEASKGLNANLNRLQTAWFNLKAELSGGLFSDAASKGALVLAENLNKVAVALQLVAGVAVARGIGGLAQRGAGNIQFAIQDFRGTQMAAAAEREYAQAQAAEVMMLRDVAAAERNKAAQTLEVIQTTRASTIATREQIKAEFALVAAQELAARKTALAATQAAQIAHDARVRASVNVERISGGAALSSNIRFSQEQIAAQTAAQAELNVAQSAYAVATAEATVAQDALTAARARYATVQQAANALSVEEDALNTALIQKNIALTASEDALAVAQARVAATRAAETAIGGLGAAIGRAAASFGSFALSLVGGPWGAATLAIGGLAYVFLSARSAAEHLEEQTKENAKAVEDLAKQAADLRSEMAQPGNFDPFIKLKDSADTAAGAMLKNAQDLAKAQERLNGLLNAQALAGEHSFASWLNDLPGQLKAAQGAVDQLTDAQRILAATYSAQESAYLKGYGQNWDGIRSILSNMQFTISGVEGAFALLRGEMNRMAESNTVVDQARIKFGQLNEALDKQVEAREKVLRQKDMNPVQRAQDDVRILLETAAKGHIAISQEILDRDKRAVAIERGIKADDDAKKAATAAESAARAQARAAADLLVSQQGELAEAKAQLEQTDKIVPAQKQLNEELAGGVKAYNGMTGAQKAASRATLEQAAALQVEYIEQQKAIRSAQALAEVRENLARIMVDVQRQMDDALAAEGIGAIEAEDARRRSQYEREFEDRKKNIDKEKALSAADRRDALADNQALLDAELAAQAKFEHDRQQIQANALNGMKSAIRDFVDAQNNMRDLNYKFTTDFITGFSDAFAAFASGTESAKKAFGDFIDSMYKEAWKFVADQTIKSLLLSFNAPGTAGAPGAGGSFWGNLKTSLTGGWGNTPQLAAETANTAALVSLTAAISAGGIMGGSGGGGFGLGGLFSSLFGGDAFSFGSGEAMGGSLFSDGLGMLASGGPASAGRRYKVAERGPELLSVGDESYLLMGSRGGHVTPTEQLRGGQGNSYTTIVNVQPTSSRRTADQIAMAASREQRTASARSA